MNRLKTLDDLNKYKVTFPEELEYKIKIIDFVKTNTDFYSKANLSGHLTCSAWLINQSKNKVLLTHHVKLNKWLQLGGHIEENELLFESALRECREESGLLNITPVQKDIFDIDIHFIPDYKSQKNGISENGHYHYDIRFIFQADSDESLIITDESNDLRWFSFSEFRNEISEWSMLRMLEKTISLTL